MKTKIGIPRGMFYYDYYLLWEEFFKNLGGEIVVSPKTNKDILNQGISACVDEACLAVKGFHGHVDYLKDKVDYIFIPKFISIHKREYCCPKHLGLPDMVRNSILDLPEIIEPVINLKDSKRSLKEAIFYSGKYLTSSKKDILKAYEIAYDKFKEFNKSKIIDKNIDLEENNRKILVLGHPYNIYDNYINMDAEKKLKENNIKIINAEMIDKSTTRNYAAKLSKRMFWTQGQRIVGSAFSLIDNGKVDGIIYISAFGCGLDSVLIELVERRARGNNIPFILLTIDEQTGEAGINTRIEAFLDMLEWRDTNEDNISTYG